MSDGEFSIMFYNVVTKIFKYILIILIIVFGFSLAFIIQHHCLSNTNVRFGFFKLNIYSIFILCLKWSNSSRFFFHLCVVHYWLRRSMLEPSKYFDFFKWKNSFFQSC